MKRSFVSLALILCFIVGLATPINAEEEYAWVLVDTYEFPIPEAFKPGDPWSYYANRMGNSIEVRTTLPYGLGAYSSKDYNNPVDMHAIYTWTNLPRVIKPKELVTLSVTQQVLSNKNGNYSIGFTPYFHFDSANMNIGSATSSKINSKNYFADGSEGTYYFGIGYGRDERVQTSFTGKMTVPFRDKGTPGQKYSLYFGVYAGSPGAVGVRYTYEWKIPPLEGAEAFGNGVRIMWQPVSGLGYRIFRSTNPMELGISVSDFFISGSSYADVNVIPNTTYHYTIKPVISEANPLQGVEEKLGAEIGKFTVKTGEEITNPGKTKNFIMLKIDNPNMSVNGSSQEVDPGRGTTPIIMSSRTVVPIRAIVESMNGTIEWDNPTQMITIKARGNTIQMWVGKTDLKINGVSKTMDVAPVIKNSRTFVPLRFVAENLNSKVDWINSTREVVIVYED